MIAIGLDRLPRKSGARVAVFDVTSFHRRADPNGGHEAVPRTVR